MGRIWYVPFSGALTAAADFAEIAPADDKPCRIRGFLVGQTTEIKEAEEEMLDVRVRRLPATFTSGSGGSAGAPWCPDSDDSTSVGFASETMNTTQASTSGTAVELSYPWNLRSNPLEVWFPDPVFAPRASQGQGLVLALMAAPADSVTFRGWVAVEEG